MSHSWTYTTWPDPDSAEAAAKQLIEEKLYDQSPFRNM